MMRKFAAFDIDGTISRTSLFLQVLDHLIDNGSLPADSRTKLDEKFIAYRNREHKKAFREYTDIAVEILFGNITALKVENYQKAVNEVVPKVSKHVYVYSRELIKHLHAEGYFLIALSGSEQFAVEQFTKGYDFNVVIGEEYTKQNNMFTGEIVKVVNRKEEILKQLIIEHDLTLEGSIAVGDSSGDISMLEFVENPIAFNPEDILYQHARENKWKIVVERKNVIFELQPDENGSYSLK